jgi:hypothetical protein
MDRCDHCGWNGEMPALREWRGKGCGGVLWTLPVRPEFGAKVHQTAIPQQPPQAQQS